MSRFMEEGYIVLDDFVPTQLVDAIAEVAVARRRDLPLENGRWSDCPDLSVPNMKPAFHFIRRRLGGLFDCVLYLVELQLSTFPKGSDGWPTLHIDGTGQIARGEKTIDDLPDHTIIVGFPCVDLSEENRGNPIVVPGGHQIVAGWMTNNHMLPPNANPLKMSCTRLFEERLQKESIYRKKQLKLRKGQIFFMHYAMPHGVGPNPKKDRTMVYLRLRPKKIALQGLAAYRENSANFH